MESLYFLCIFGGHNTTTPGVNLKWLSVCMSYLNYSIYQKKPQPPPQTFECERGESILCFSDINPLFRPSAEVCNCSHMAGEWLQVAKAGLLSFFSCLFYTQFCSFDPRCSSSSPPQHFPWLGLLTVTERPLCPADPSTVVRFIRFATLWFI